ncbi:hypothetical protein WP50_28005 [Lactiplantibacillus plantarum]|nr:hypothetical protein WP50_28005 [Lactiplantibacillus plantarum]
MLLTIRIDLAAAVLLFFRSSDVRHQLHYIDLPLHKMCISYSDNTPRDLFNFYLDKGWLSIQVFFIRQARLMKREKRLFPVVSTAPEEMTSFILQFYNRKNNVLPREVLVPNGLDKRSRSS